jgi:aminocarboxymuconate-semialdehyde decarboxylase
MIIDTHAHFVPQTMLDAVVSGSASFKNIEVLKDDKAFKLAFMGAAPTRPIMPKLRELETREAWLSENGIDVQISGGWLDSFAYGVPADEGAAWSRFMNEHLLEQMRGKSYMEPLATVPLQDGMLAAEVLREAMAAGFSGAMIGTQPKGLSGNLDDPELDPFWEAASETGAALYLHPMFGCGDDRLLDYDMINAVGRGVDTTTAIARMIYAGHFTKYNGMKMVLSHGGGALPYVLGRMNRNYLMHKDDGYADPVEQMANLWYDTVLFDPRTLRFLVELFGAEKVVLGSDYPFPIGDMTPCKIVHDANLSEVDTSAILGDNAAKLFRLDGDCSGH